MPVLYIKTDQSSNVTTGTGVPTHSGVAGDRYTDTATGNTYQYTTSWQTVSYSAGGLTYFTEAQNTSAPNATVPVDSLTAVSGATNADFAIRPKGTGAILANIPDNLAAGGNKRGLNAVDLQISRSNSAQVASGDYSVLLGGLSNTVSGVYSMVGGVNSNVTGARSFAYGSSCTSNGYCSIALSENATASGDNSFAHGLQTSATGYASVAIGRNAVSSNVYSMAFGAFTIADANSSIAFNNNAHTFGVTGRIVFSSTGIGTRGDAQSSKLVLRKLTTDNTPTILTSDNGSVASANQLTLSNNNTIRVKGSIIGRQTGSTNTSAWDIDCLIQRGVGVGTTTLLISNVNVVQNTPAWGTPTLTANTTLGCLTVTVTGAITTNIQWVCVIDTAEVIYA